MPAMTTASVPVANAPTPSTSRIATLGPRTPAMRVIVTVGSETGLSPQITTRQPSCGGLLPHAVVLVHCLCSGDAHACRLAPRPQLGRVARRRRLRSGGHGGG